MIDMKFLQRTPAYLHLWKKVHIKLHFDSSKYLENIDDNSVFFGLMLITTIGLELAYVFMGYFRKVYQYFTNMTSYEAGGLICAVLGFIAIILAVSTAYAICVITLDKVVIPALIKVIMFVCIVKDLKYWNKQIDKYIKERTPELAFEIDNFIARGLQPHK